MDKKIAILAGDGIGPEVMQQTLRVLERLTQKYRHRFTYQEAPIGGAAYAVSGEHCPDETLAICAEADAILFGSVGGPVNQQQLPQWKNCEANSILRLRQYFTFNVNLRPIQVYPELSAHCPLKPEISDSSFDFLIFRELTGGLYFGQRRRFVQNELRQASDECVYDEKQIRSIAQAAFAAARARSKRLCSVDKANVLATSKLWREVVRETARDYPDVTCTEMLVDNCAMQLVKDPRQFDVIVTENMFGDILSDLGAALTGSIGLIPSVSLNAQGKGLYEPAGGSAPELAGKGLANPVAQMLSAALLLRHSFGLQQEAKELEEAIRAVIRAGQVTADLAADARSACSTEAFTDAVLECI
jgi:3-isopropylmalate dehydrogenase